VNLEAILSHQFYNLPEREGAAAANQTDDPPTFSADPIRILPWKPFQFDHL